jgi:hypothetical protein
MNQQAKKRTEVNSPSTCFSPLEGFARLLGLALQVKDCGLLLLEGLA